jgi:proteasome lid subunit RPN8/RPN11
MDIRVTRPVLDRLLAEAARASPAECCGILLGCGTLIEAARPATNVAPNPERRFEIDPQTLIDAHRASRGGGLRVVGYYHSHPNGPAEPSATDRRQSAGDGSVWAIIGESGTAFWSDEEAGFVPLSYAVLER